MANKTFLDLPVASALNGTEVVPLDQGGATKQATAAAIAALAPVQDHNLLTNLAAGDAHPQYYNQARGDARYVVQTINISTGNGLQGGGDLSTSRSLSVKATAQRGIAVTANGVELDMVGVGSMPESIDGANDLIVIYNVSEARPRTASVSQALAGASGFVPTARQIASGAGLSGGGDLSIDRTLAVGQGVGIDVQADTVGLDVAHARNVDHSAVTFSAGTGLTGGGTLAANRSFSLDTSSSRNVDHASISISVANSLTGGGDLTASRSIALSGDVAAPGNWKIYSTNGAGTRGWNDFSFTNIQGNIAAAQVPASAVTQHQNALAIAWTQLTGVSSAAAQFSSVGAGTPAPAAGGIRATGDIVAFFSSDKRLKENVKVITDALAIVEALRGVRFDWTQKYLNEHGDMDGYFNRKSDVGVIAQEVEKVLPEIVGVRSDGIMAVKYDRLTAVLIEAVKELSARVQALEAK